MVEFIEPVLSFIYSIHAFSCIQVFLDTLMAKVSDYFDIHYRCLSRLDHIVPNR